MRHDADLRQCTPLTPCMSCQAYRALTRALNRAARRLGRRLGRSRRFRSLDELDARRVKQ